MRRIDPVYELEAACSALQRRTHVWWLSSLRRPRSSRPDPGINVDDNLVVLYMVASRQIFRVEVADLQVEIVKLALVEILEHVHKW